MALLAAVIHLKPSRPLPMWLGRAAQAWLLDSVRRADPALARALHGDPGSAQGQDRRPYTISVQSTHSPTHNDNAPQDDSSDPDQPWLRITSYTPNLTALLEQALLPRLSNLHDPITLAGIEIEIVSVVTTGHSWAGRSDYEQIARQAYDLNTHVNADTDRDCLRPAFHFATPTAFRHKGLLVPLPLPEMVY